MRNRKRVLLLFIILIFCTSCAKEEEIREDSANLILPDTTIYDKDASEMVVVAENNYLKLSYQENTAQFTVTNKRDGSIFRSITQEPALVQTEQSLLEIYYMDSKNNFGTMYSFSDSIERGQYKTEYLENGIKISFAFGEISGNVFCPPAISKERFEAIVEKIEGSFDKQRLKQSYFLPNFDTITKERANELLQKYPRLETEPLYILAQDSLPDSMKKEISRILQDTGYTQEDYEIDMQNAGELTANKSTIFILNMYIMLEEDKLCVRVPVKEIEELNGGKIIHISILKNFASPEYEEKGQFIIPDSSGSLMKFYNGKGDLSEIKVPVYGLDRSIPVDEQIFKKEQAYLPIFSIQYQNKAVLGRISDGEAFAEIHAWPGSEIAHGKLYPTFILRQNIKSYLGSDSTGAEAFTILQRQLYDGNLEVEYYFLDKNNNEIAEIANFYSDILFADSKEGKTDSAIYLEFIGAVYEKKSDMSFGFAELEVFTTIQQVREILEDLVQEGIGGQLVVRLNGFSKGGLDNEGIQAFQLNKKLGKEQELKELIIWAKEQGIEIYLDFDPQYVYGDKLLDGFSKHRDTAYQIKKVYGEDYPYDPSTFQRNEYHTARYILNPLATEKIIKLNSNKLSIFGDVGISLRDIGKDLNSDFRKNNAIERQNAKKLLENSISQTDFSQKIITNGANAYVLPYVSHILRIETSKQRFDIADQSIPFLQMVLRDKVGYSDIPVNLSSNSQNFVLSSLGTGAGYTYILTGENEKSLRKTTHSEYYSTQYSVWKEDILKKAALLAERNKYISGKTVRFEILEDNVYLMIYENGGWILWNTSDLEYPYKTTIIKPNSYIMGGE